MNNPNYQFLTYKEKQIVEIAKYRGYVFLADCNKVYASKTNMMNALKRLCNMGFLVENAKAFGRFDYVFYLEEEQEQLEIKK